MISRVLVKDVKGNESNEVTVCGFVDAVRNQKRMQFLIIRDHTGKIQAIHAKDGDNDPIAAAINSLTVESAVSVTGRMVVNPSVKLGGCEIEITDIKIHSLAETPLPITDESDLELQIDWRQLSLRRRADQLVINVQTTLESGMRAYWHTHGFTEIHSPKLMGSASEGGAELFQVPYFNDRMACLAQSPQFYKQMAIAGGFDRVFEIGPVFRANPSFTSRHDTEFTSVDMEVAWVQSHEDVMCIEEEWLAQSLALVAAIHGDEIASVFGAEIIVPTLPFPRVTLLEARKVLEAVGHVIDHKADLDPQGERLLSEYIARELGHEFVFVTDYPADVRAFYHMRYDDQPNATKSFDLLWKGLEITTGAQREHRLDRLRNQALSKGIPIEGLEHYLNFFRYGCPPHGGCGIGLTRLLMTMLNRPNVREVTLLYRGPNRLTP
jgi:aspartyl-tRNA synthetase